MTAHEQVVQSGDAPFHAFHPNEAEMFPMGTYVQLGAGDPAWWADGLEKAILYCLRYPRRIRITALRFNGEIIFDDRPPNKRRLKPHRFKPIKPITVKVRKPNIPEWSKSNE